MPYMSNLPLHSITLDSHLYALSACTNLFFVCVNLYKSSCLQLSKSIVGPFYSVAAFIGLKSSIY
jgi:hypothetical protein